MNILEVALKVKLNLVGFRVQGSARARTPCSVSSEVHPVSPKHTHCVHTVNHQRFNKNTRIVPSQAPPMHKWHSHKLDQCKWPIPVFALLANQAQSLLAPFQYTNTMCASSSWSRRTDRSSRWFLALWALQYLTSRPVVSLVAGC